MKVLAGFIFAFLLICHCYGQAEQPGYDLKLDFEPSFTHSAIVDLHCKSNSSTISIVTEKDNTKSVNVKSNCFDSLTALLRTNPLGTISNTDAGERADSLKQGDALTNYRLATDGHIITFICQRIRNNKKEHLAEGKKFGDAAKRKLLPVVFDLLKKNFPKNFMSNFDPAFSKPGYIIISWNGSSGIIKLTSYKKYTDSVNVKYSDFAPITDLLKNYQFRIKNSIDTVGSHKVLIGKDSVLVYDIEGGTDGIMVKGSLNKDGHLKHFAFWSPREGTENARFMDIVFDLMERYFIKDSTYTSIELIKDYFPHKLMVRRISKKPLKYKLYGDVSPNDLDQLLAFLKSLPKSQNVLIDVSATYIAPLYDVQEYCYAHKNIYWLDPNKYLLKKFKEAEINKRQVVFDKDRPQE